METYSVELLNTNRVIRQLALEWIQSSLPADEVTFVDCLNVLNQLQASTQAMTRSEQIFERVFQQAKELGKSSDWVAIELGFEALAQGVACRADLAMHCLKQDGIVDDAALDCYNERISRFKIEPVNT